LAGKRKPDDGDAQHHGRDQVPHRNPRSKEHQPDDIEYRPDEPELERR
jgi:hypothetical protein